MIDIPLSAEARRMRRVALGDLVYRSAKKFGARNAVVDGDLRLTYADLDVRSSRFAHHLIASIGSGRQVGMLCANSADMLVAVNGIHKSGNIWVPVNIKLEPETIEYILERSAETGESYLPEQVEGVVECQLAYLRFIGAVGRAAGPDETPGEAPGE